MASSSSDTSDSESSGSSQPSAPARRPQQGSSPYKRVSVTSSEETESSEDESPIPQPAATSPGAWAGYEEESDEDGDDSPVASSQPAPLLAQNEDAVYNRSLPEKPVHESSQGGAQAQVGRNHEKEKQDELERSLAEGRIKRERRVVENWLRICDLHLDRDYQAQKIGLQLEHTLEKQQEQQRQRLEEESRRRKLQEEAEHRQRIMKEENERMEAEARQREEQRLVEVRKKAEIEQLQTREASFWSMLAPEEEQRLRGMLQVVLLYQQQLSQNERVLSDLQEGIDSKEKAYQKLDQRVQRASHDSKVARELEDRARDELGRWTRKREQYESPGQDIEALRRRQHTLQSELQKLQEHYEPLRIEAGTIREKLSSSDEKSGMLASQLVSIKSKSQQTAAALKADNVEELAALHAQHTQEFAKVEVDAQNQLQDIRVKHAQEASTLRLDLEEANRRKEKLRQERDFTGDQLLEGQREGARLQGLCADARQEVLELSAQLKASGFYPSQASLLGSRPRSLSMSQLGKTSPTSPATSQKLDSSTCSMAGGRYNNSEMQLLRKRCKQLEKECSRTHAALEKKHEACVLWRKRSFEQGDRIHAVAEAPVPFTLGPADKETELRLLSPNGTRTL